jgi:hypothetical protein
MKNINIILVAIWISARSVSLAGTDGLPDIIVQPNRGPLTAADVSAAEEVGYAPGGASVVDSEEFRDGRASTVSHVIGSTPGACSETRSGDETTEPSGTKAPEGMELER